MKTGLVSAIVVAVLLLGSLIYWKSRPPEGAIQGIHFQAETAAPESSLALSNEAAGPEESARSAATPATRASPTLEGDLASSSATPRGYDLATVSTSDHEKREKIEPGDEVFERKYAGMNNEARQVALESLRVLVEGSREGGLGKGHALTEAQSLELKREMEWLTQHPG